MQHALGQLDAAPQAAGERFDAIAAAIGQPQPREHFVLPARERSARQAVQVPLVHEVLGHGQLLVEARRLKHDADPPADRLAFARRRSKPRIADVARLQRNQRREQAKQRGLAAAVGTEEGEDLARLDLQAQIRRAPRRAP